MANDLGQYLLKKTEAYCKKCVAIFLLFFVTKAFLPKMYVMQNKKFIFGFEVAYCLHFFYEKIKILLLPGSPPWPPGGGREHPPSHPVSMLEESPLFYRYYLLQVSILFFYRYQVLFLQFSRLISHRFTFFFSASAQCYFSRFPAYLILQSYFFLQVSSPLSTGAPYHFKRFLVLFLQVLNTISAGFKSSFLKISSTCCYRFPVLFSASTQYYCCNVPVLFATLL